jgi:hypothetical protein
MSLIEKTIGIAGLATIFTISVDSGEDSFLL